jgi:hypothetical protein
MHGLPFHAKGELSQALVTACKETNNPNAFALSSQRCNILVRSEQKAHQTMMAANRFRYKPPDKHTSRITSQQHK